MHVSTPHPLPPQTQPGIPFQTLEGLRRDGGRRKPHRHRIDASRAHPLVRRFYELVLEQQMSLTEVAKKAGIHSYTMSRWRTHNSPTVESLEAVLNVLGYRLVVRPVCEKRLSDIA